jgi:hypothetical protein
MELYKFALSGLSSSVQGQEEKTFPIREKMGIAKVARKALSEFLVPSDVIINSEEEVEIKKNRIGCITRYAIEEGIVI